MHHGFPASTGVALGFDRLVMVALGGDGSEQVMAFPIDRASNGVTWSDGNGRAATGRASMPDARFLGAGDWAASPVACCTSRV